MIWAAELVLENLVMRRRAGKDILRVLVWKLGV